MHAVEVLTSDQSLVVEARLVVTYVQTNVVVASSRSAKGMIAYPPSEGESPTTRSVSKRRSLLFRDLCRSASVNSDIAGLDISIYGTGFTADELEVSLDPGMVTDLM